ncbi:helix-turn-helix domain-containing protein [Delftia acidovorans]|uniref:helix-turn-helix domain-containing protein n=1 Tax=Delftia acidovorans TaxID=80866 RepID=UPI000F82ED43|nr:helix-turn-helix domain-containing protein [Delftia acidovorans]
MNTENSFGERLLRARVGKRLSQSALAAAVGITPAQISRYESGKNMPRPHITAQLAEALGVDARWLEGSIAYDPKHPHAVGFVLPENSGFVDRLRTARIANEFSQADLAHATGIAAAQISRYESGRNYPRPHIIAKLASVLGVTADWLTGEGQAAPLSSDQEGLLGGKQEFTFQPSANSLEKLQALSVLTGKTPDELVQQMFEELEVTLHGSFLKSIHGTMPAAQGHLTLRPTSPIIRVTPDGTTQEITLEELAKAVASEIQKKPD